MPIKASTGSSKKFPEIPCPIYMAWLGVNIICIRKINLNVVLYSVNRILQVFEFILDSPSLECVIKFDFARYN